MTQSQDNVRLGDCSYLANGAIATGLCLIATTTANTVGVPTAEGQVPMYVSKSASTASGEYIDVKPIQPGDELRIRANGTIAAGDLCEITLSGADAGKIVTLATGCPRFVAITAASDEDLTLVRALPSDGRSTGQPTAATLNATGTMASGDLTAGIITSSTAAAVSGTTRTGTQISAELTWIAIGQYHDVHIVNTGATNAFTLVAGTDVTIVGGDAIAAVKSATFRFKKLTATTWSATRIAG